MAPAEAEAKPADTKPADKRQPALLEEDDEFEEFEEENWDGTETDPTNAQLWVDTWDDDSTGDDFTKQLRQELERK